MEGWPKDTVIQILKTDLINIRDVSNNFTKFGDNLIKEHAEYLVALEEQICDTIRNHKSGPLIPKTPKVPRKKNVKRIKTIPEDDVIKNETDASDTVAEPSSADDHEDEDLASHKLSSSSASSKTLQTTKKQRASRLTDKTRLPSEEEDIGAPRASRRAASLKASNNILKLQTSTLRDKLRRPLEDEENSDPSPSTKGSSVKASQNNQNQQTKTLESENEDSPIEKPVRANRAKRTNSVAISSDEEEPKRLKKKFSNAKPRPEETITIKSESVETYLSSIKEDNTSKSTRSSRSKRLREDADEVMSNGYTKNSQEPAAKKAYIVNETMDIPEADVTVEPSMYEDAVGKSIPMNSTMNPNSTVTFDRKMMNVTVVLEAMQVPHRMNETVTLKKQSSGSNRSSRNDTLVNEEPQTNKVFKKSPIATKSVFQTKSALQDRMKALKETMANKEFNALLTDDESSPERKEEKKIRKIKKPEIKSKKKVSVSSLFSEDDDTVPATPPRTILREANLLKGAKPSYKTTALFSPWSKDTVKKRVEAFEQVGLNSPKSVDIDAPTRQTRTKTRAMAAAAAAPDEADKSIVQKVAREASRKSLAKAKKIAQMKEIREKDERKENNSVSSAQKPSRLLATAEKISHKHQPRTTPVGKSRLQMPMSVNRIQHTPVNNPILNQKPQTVSRSNIITSIDSFISKPISKAPSTDNLTEKKKKVNDEDARRKKEEALRAKMEEKKRKREEKELRNKLAREANEKLDMEKRLKQEKERDEKARAAQLLQERQREESERKKLLQLQRAQEKEERRRQEEQLRLQRLQEQEEAERQLAEQKRREQEAERRRQAEARAQHIAAAEAARLKAQMVAQAKAAKEKNQPQNYKIDSDPDDDDSDDENAPRHAIPYWALPQVRAVQLKINKRIPMPVVHQFFGARRCTPNLAELFKGIKKERLQRTSSAIWKTPPRYSMMENEY